MNHYLSKKEINERIRALALEITIEDINRCIKTLHVIRKILVKEA